MGCWVEQAGLSALAACDFGAGCTNPATKKVGTTVALTGVTKASARSLLVALLHPLRVHHDPPPSLALTRLCPALSHSLPC
eukprot:2188564-Rhodomonas_salina.2